MSRSAQLQSRTWMFARVLGPFFAIIPTTVAIRGSYMRTLFIEFQANPMWPWLFGAILLMLGLLVIAFHQYWRNPAAVIVSLLGWFLFVRGVLLLVVPQAYDAVGNAIYSSGAIAAMRVLFVGLGLAGLYLTYVGWQPVPGTPEAAGNRDQPDAAGR